MQAIYHHKLVILYNQLKAILVPSDCLRVSSSLCERRPIKLLSRVESFVTTSYLPPYNSGSLCDLSYWRKHCGTQRESLSQGPERLSL
jgi:hypothetical protein